MLRSIKEVKSRLRFKSFKLFNYMDFLVGLLLSMGLRRRDELLFPLPLVGINIVLPSTISALLFRKFKSIIACVGTPNRLAMLPTVSPFLIV